MPIYEYRCKVCGHQFERLQRLSDPNPPCPYKRAPERIKSVGSEEVVGEVEVAACGGGTTKLISSTTFQLRGGGWEADGYA